MVFFRSGLLFGKGLTYQLPVDQIKEDKHGKTYPTSVPRRECKVSGTGLMLARGRTPRDDKRGIQP